MNDVIVHPGEILACAKQVGALTATSTGLNNSATDAAVPEISWGMLGQMLGLYQQYDQLLGQLHDHFSKMSDGFGKIEQALTVTANAYHDNDRASADSFGKIMDTGLANATTPTATASAAPNPTSNAGALGKSYANQYAVDGGKGNLISQSAKLIPLGSSSYSMIKDSAKLGDDVKKGDVEAVAKDVVSVISDMNDFMQEGVKMAGVIADPLNFLITKGLGWLLNVVAPLKQAVDLVTGDPTATSKAATKFNDIAKQTDDLAKTFDDQLNKGLRSWRSAGADAAAKKLTGFHDGIAGTAGTAGHIASILQGSSMFMQAAEDIIKGVLSDLIEWLVVTWIAAQLAAIPTCGASEALAAEGTVVEAGIATTKATGEVNRIRGIIQKIMDVLRKIRDVLRESKVGKEFVKNVEEANKEKKTLGEALDKSITKQKEKLWGGDKSTGPDGESKYRDPVKIGNKMAGYADGAYKTVAYDQHGNKQDDGTVNEELDI